MTRRELGGAALLLACAVSLFLAPALARGRVLSAADLLFGGYPWRAHPPPGWSGPGNGLLGDSMLSFEPWLTYAARRLHAGELPLWNPDNMLGAPLFGNMQSALLDPLNAPYLLWPDGLLLNLRAWLRLFLAALGMYLLARQGARAGPLGALVAALTFALGAYLTVWLLYPLAGTAIWLPWLWWATARLVARPGPQPVALLAAFVALSLVAGHPETAYHMALASGLFALFQIAQAGPARPGRIARDLGRLLAAYALGAGLAAVQLLPFGEYLTQSWVLASRASGPGFSLPFHFAWTLISPDLFGNPAHGDWWAPGVTFNYNEVNAYSGIVPLVLAPLALLTDDKARRRLVLFLLGLGALAAGVVFRAPLVYEAVTALPLLRNAANHRLLLVIEFALALLAGLGVTALEERLPEARRRLLAVPAATVLALGLVGVVVPWALAHSYFALPAGAGPALATWQASLQRAAVLLLAAGGLLAAAIGLARARPRLATGLLGLLPLLVLADLGSAHGDYNPGVAPAARFPPAQVTTYLRAQPGPFRFTGLIPPNTNLVYGLAALTGYDAVEARTYHELVTYIDPLIPRNNRRHFSPFDMLQSRIWNLLGVRYVLAAPGDDPNYLPDVRQEASSSQNVGEIRGAAQPGQTFVSSHDNLAEIQVLGATYGGRARGHLLFHLKTDPAAPADLATVVLDASRLVDNSWWTIRFAPVQPARGRTFYFWFESPDAGPGQGATVWYSASATYADGTRLAGGRPAPGDLTFRTFSRFDPQATWLAPLRDCPPTNPCPTDASIYVNQQAQPRAWLVHQVAVEPDATARMPRLYDPAFAWARTALLAAPLAPAQVLPAVPPPTASEAVTITGYAPEAVTLRAASPAPGLLVLADQAFPGWSATVDGVAASIIPVDHALRGLYLTPGVHEVAFRYTPLSFTLGAILSAAALLLLGFCAFATKLHHGGTKTRSSIHEAHEVRSGY